MEKIEFYYSIFNNYVKYFDLKNKGVVNKFHHTYRVMEHAKDIASSLNLSQDDIELAQICALFHDIGRFKQVIEYNTFIDSKSFDHGDMAYEIMSGMIDKLNLSEENSQIVLKAVKYHNKFNVPSDLLEREILFANITRDADKLDIMMEQAYSINDGIFKINDETVEALFKKQLVPNKIVNTSVDEVIRVLSFTFDINYDYSLKVVRDIIISKKMDLLKANIEDSRIDQIENFIKQYINERIK